MIEYEKSSFYDWDYGFELKIWFFKTVQWVRKILSDIDIQKAISCQNSMIFPLLFINF